MKNPKFILCIRLASLCPLPPSPLPSHSRTPRPRGSGRPHSALEHNSFPCAPPASPRVGEGSHGDLEPFQRSANLREALSFSSGVFLHVSCPSHSSHADLKCLLPQSSPCSPATTFPILLIIFSLAEEKSCEAEERSDKGPHQSLYEKWNRAGIYSL